MRKSLAIAVVMFGCTLSAMAWNCNTPGQVERKAATWKLTLMIRNGD